MSFVTKFLRVLVLGFFLLAEHSEAAAVVQTKYVKATLLSSHDSLSPGQNFHVGLFFKIVPHWHVYWSNPGDSGEAPRFSWTLPEGLSAGEIQWPVPSRIPLSMLANYGYEDEVLFPVAIRVPENYSAKNLQVKLEADWLVCREECVPEKGSFEISVPVGATSQVSEDETTFSYTLENVPQPFLDSGASYEVVDDSRIRLRVPLEKIGAKRPDFRFEIFPKDDGLFEAGVLHETEHDDKELQFVLTLTPQALKLPENLGFVLKATALKTDQPSIALEFETSPPQAVTAVDKQKPLGFWFALLGAFLGGLLLNLMPCVLPVLSLKAFSVLKSRADGKTSLRPEGGAYVLGILVSFWALAGLLLVLRASGEALGWGFQLQNPVFVLVMIVLFVGLSLNFFGIFEMGHSLQTWSGRLSVGEPNRGVLRSAFMSGVLATLIATPCTAPFMGSAVGLALSLPALQALVIFTALGVGMALPVFLIYFFPSTLRALPRPGPWMESFKQFMGFPMLATAPWLLWVYGLQTDLDAVVRLLFALVSLALGGWVFGRFERSKKKFAALLVIFGLFVWLLRPLLSQEPATFRAGSETKLRADYSGLEYEDYSEKRLAALLGEKRPVYVDFTAAWCLTCQVNKRIVFPDAEVQKLFIQERIVILKGDWTDKNPALLAVLERFGRSGVPLNLYYRPEKPQDPVVLPSVLRAQTVIDAIRQASP